MTQSNRCIGKWRILVICLLAALLLVSGASAASTLLQTVDETRAVGSAGFTSITVGSVTLQGTLGQPFVGVSQSGNINLGHGFWHGREESHTIFLPVVKLK